jgi:hypothetical protein
MRIATDWVCHDGHLGYLAWPERAATPLPTTSDHRCMNLGQGLAAPWAAQRSCLKQSADPATATQCTHQLEGSSSPWINGRTVPGRTCEDERLELARCPEDPSGTVQAPFYRGPALRPLGDALRRRAPPAFTWAWTRKSWTPTSKTTGRRAPPSSGSSLGG